MFAILQGAILLVATVMILLDLRFSGGRATTFCLAVPFGLTWTHVVAQACQKFNKGPEWVQNHLHNVGAPALVTPVALLWASRRIRSRRMTSRKAAKFYVNTILWSWIAGALLGCTQEIMLVTVWRESTVADGYSGQLDWLDIYAYALGVGLMIANHIKWKPAVLREASSLR